MSKRGPQKGFGGRPKGAKKDARRTERLYDRLLPGTVAGLRRQAGSTPLYRHLANLVNGQALRSAPTADMEQTETLSAEQRWVLHFDEYPESIRPMLRDIRTRKGRVLAICEYQCRQCGLKMDDTQSEVNDAHTRACCPRCRSEDLRDSDYVPNKKLTD